MLVRVDGEPCTSTTDLTRMVRAKGVDRRFTFQVLRNGRTLALAGDAPPLPVETFEGADVLLGHVDVSGHRQRALFTLPAARRARGAIVYLQPIRAESCEAPLVLDAPIRKLVQALVDLGWIVLRVERGGVGDSEGPGPDRTDLSAELDGYRAGLDQLRDLEDMSGPTLLFGHSLGGIVAPLVARDTQIDGAVVFGASLLPWTECVRGTSRRQRALKGFANDALDAEVARWHELMSLVCREGWTPSRAFSERAHLRPLESRECNGDTVYGRHVSLLRELEAIDLEAAWRSFEGRVLALHGEHDWVCSAEESVQIARRCGDRGTYTELPAIAHDMLRYPSLEVSMTNARVGVWDRSVTDAFARWVG